MQRACLDHRDLANWVWQRMLYLSVSSGLHEYKSLGSGIKKSTWKESSFVQESDLSNNSFFGHPRPVLLDWQPGFLCSWMVNSDSTRLCLVLAGGAAPSPAPRLTQLEHRLISCQPAGDCKMHVQTATECFRLFFFPLWQILLYFRSKLVPAYLWEILVGL